jgi:serine/threonine protein kinase
MTSAGQSQRRSGRRVGKYLLTGRIGRGGMGMVYRGFDEALEREVAVKTLTTEATLDDESRRRFEIEAKAAAKLQHPNIVTVFELGEDRGIPFIAMELLPGVDLETLLRSGEPILLQEKLETVMQVCRGLAYAHDHRIVHRDIKPSNIRILDDGTAKIMDFGIAKLGATQVTKSGMMVGTIHYMSPEQILGKSLDGRSDVFSVGVILYELLEGRRPFAGDAPTDVLYKIVHAHAPPMAAELGPSGGRLQHIVEKALAKEQDARYATAARLADDLAEVLMAYTRAVASGSGDTGEAVSASRRLLKEGRVEECVQQLRELTDRTPQSLEARRALRVATREMMRRQKPEPEADDFPELAATFQVPPTVREPETVLQQMPAPLAPAASGGMVSGAAPAEPGRTLAWAGAAFFVVALAAGAVLVTRKHRSTDPPNVAASVAPVRGVEATPGPVESPRAVASPAVGSVVVAAATTLSVVSDPRGASVSLDGLRVDGSTPLSLQLDARVEHRLTLSAEGYATAEVRLSPGRIPPEVRVALQPQGPAGTIQVTSSYPLDVLWKGRVMSKGLPSPQVGLPAGHQILTLVSGTYFLKMDVPVEVRGGVVAALDAPALGKVNIRANPDNCEVFIDGTFVDYPPILEKSVAAGHHTIAFKWADGTRREESVQVAKGSPAYVTGRKD